MIIFVSRVGSFSLKTLALLIKFLILHFQFFNLDKTMSNIPAELKYSNDHEWCRVEGEYAYVGITDFAQSELGDIVFVDIQTEGETLAAGDIFGTIEAVKTVSDAFTPVSGEVVEVNPAIDADPALVNSDPYGEGWMVKIKMSAPEEVEALLSADDYAAFIAK